MDKKELLETYKKQLLQGTLKDSLKSSFSENIKNDINICRNLKIEDYEIVSSSNNLLYNIIKVYMRGLQPTSDTSKFVASVIEFINKNIIDNMDDFTAIVSPIIDSNCTTLSSYIHNLFNLSTKLTQADLYFIKFLILYFYRSREEDILNLCSTLAFQIINSLFDDCQKYEFFKTKEIDIDYFMEEYTKIESCRKYKIGDLYKYLYYINVPDFTDYNDDFYIMIDIYRKLQDYKHVLIYIDE